MPYGPENSAIKLNAEQENHLRSLATAEEIKSYLASVAAGEQGSAALVRRDIFSPDVLIPVEPSTSPRTFSRKIAVDGIEKVITADTELALEKSVGAFYREQFAAAPAAAEQPRDEDGRFVSAAEHEAAQLELVRQSDLELRFKRGEIDTSTYLAESGAIERHLESQGISVEDLRSAVSEKSAVRFERSWSDATTEFLNSPAGADWPGGQENLQKAGELIQANKLEEQPGAETLAAVWKFMKENNLAVENKEATAHQKISKATSYSEIQDSLGSRGSGLFGR